MDRLRLVVADEHELVRALTVALLISEFEVVASVADGEKLVEASLLHKPDVIITEIHMPLIDGVGVRQELRSQGLDTPFVFLTTLTAQEFPAILEGPVAFVHKTDLVGELALAIRAAAVGQTYLSRSFQSP